MRHEKVTKRITAPDTIYNNVTVAKLINYIMRDGKKSVAQTQIYNAFELLAKKGEDPMKIFERAMPKSDQKWKLKHGVSEGQITKFLLK